MQQFKQSVVIQEGKDLSKYGKDFQIKLISLLIKDRPFSFSILPILKDIYFSDVYLRVIFAAIKHYIQEHNTTPSIDNLKIIIQLLGEKLPVYEKILDTIDSIGLEDRDFVTKNSRIFAFTKHALSENELMIQELKQGNFDKAKKISIEAFQYSGLESAKILDLKKDIDTIYKKKSSRTPAPTMFPTFNNNSDGGIAEGELCVVVAESNFGKSFGKGTKIRMADTTLKNVENVIVGDKVMGSDGLERTVATIHSGTRDLFKVNQKIGRPYIVNDEHILCLKQKEELIEISVKDFLKLSSTIQKESKGYKSQIDSKDNNISIDSYFLGLWLSDTFESVNIETEIKNYIKDYFRSLNLTNEKYDSLICSKPFDLKICFENSERNILGEKLKEFNLILDRKIPHNYIFSSRETRLQLLAGLIDFSGGIEIQTSINYFIANKRYDVSWQIYLIATSLGFRADMKKRSGYYKIIISGETELIPVKLIDKKTEKRKKINDSLSTDIEIVNIGKGQYFGFSLVEENKQFLLEDFTVVHNSQWLVAEARHLNSLGKNVAFFSYEMEAEPLIQKYLAGVFEIAQNKVLEGDREEIQKRLNDISLGNLKIITDKASNATLANIKMHIEYLKSIGFFTDTMIIDGLNQLKLPVGVRTKDDNEKYETLTESLKDLCKELNISCFAVAQTNRCLKINSKVDIQNKGIIEIKDVCEGDKILTKDGYKTITKKYEIEKQPVYRIKLKNGKEITCSANHEFPTSTKELKSITDGLSVNDKLLCKK